LGKRRTFFVFKGLNGKKKGGKEMKALSGKAREVMDLLTKGLHTGGHRVIDNSEGAYMAVHVEKLRLTEQERFTALPITSSRTATSCGIRIWSS